MRRTGTLFFLLTLIASGCGGGDESTVTTTTGAPATGATSTTTAAPGGTDGSDTSTTVPDGSDTGFCAFVSEVEEAQEGVDISRDVDTFRESVEASVAALERARDLAPDEIRDDVELVATTFADFAELLDEYAYDLMAIAAGAANDPRFLAFDGDELAAATERIGEFCGIDLGEGVDTGDDEPADGDVGDPGSLVETLTPPGVTESVDIGNGTTLFRSDASFPEATEFYLEVLGAALFVNEDEESAVWNTTYEGAVVSVNVSGQDGGLEILVAVLG